MDFASSMQKISS